MRTTEFQTTHWVEFQNGARVPVPTAELIRLALHAAAETAWESCYFKREEQDQTSEPVLRALIVYCLGTGRYSAEEIEAARDEDPAAAYLCGRFTPQAKTIHEFRRRHARSVRNALVIFFRGITMDRLANANSTGNLAEISCLAEADERVHRAIAADTLASDF
jgi:hypothetical protein